MSVPNPATTDWVPLWNLGPPASYVPSAKVYRTTTQAISASAQVAISFDAKEWDTDTMWSAGAPTRLTCKTAGKYLVVGALWLSGGTGTLRLLNLLKNNVVVSDQVGPVANCRMNASMILDLQVGDYVELSTFNDSAVTADSNPRTPWLEATYLGPNAPLGAVIPPTYGTSLPASPVDGQEAVLVDSIVNPTYQWRFRYNAGSSSAYKWEFVGGSPAINEVLPQENTLSNVYVDLATVGPQLTAPRAGEYVIAYGAMTMEGASGQYAILSPKLGAAAVSGNDYIATYSAAGGATEAAISRSIRRTLAAGDLVKLQYQTTLATINAYFRFRWLTLVPVRVS
jgi:hypothetical protein